MTTQPVAAGSCAGSTVDLETVRPTELSKQAAIKSPWNLYSQVERRLFLTLLFLVATANYFDYFVMAVLLEPIKKEFHISDAGLGILSGFCFAVLYAITALPIARWADRGNRRNVIILTLGSWSILTAACGCAQNFWQLAIARLGVGAVEPGALPPAQSLITDFFPPDKRASATAIVTQGGSATGWLVGIGLGGYLAAVHGWRLTFLYAGVPGVILAGVVWFALREPRMRLGFPTGAEHDERLREALLRLGAKSSYVLLLAGISVYAVFTYGMTTFLPSFMIRSLHVSMVDVSLPWGGAIAVANLAGAVAGGTAADRLSVRDLRWHAWIPSLGCALALPLYALALVCERFQTFILTEFIAEFVLAAGLPPVFVALQIVSGASRRTIAIACALLLFALVGSGLGPPIAGYISDVLAPRFGSESLRYALMVLLLFLAPAAFLLWYAGIKLRGDAEQWTT